MSVEQHVHVVRRLTAIFMSVFYVSVALIHHPELQWNQVLVAKTTTVWNSILVFYCSLTCLPFLLNIYIHIYKSK